MKNYIDEKVIIWKRYHFTDQTDMEALAAIIKEDGIMQVIDDNLGFVETETLYETERPISTKDNDDNPTIEIYQNEEEVWNNMQP